MMAVGDIHSLVIRHGRERAKEVVPASKRYLVDIAAEVLADDTQNLGITYSGFCLTGFPHSASPRASGGGGRGDDGPVGDGPGADGLLDEPGEAVADALGGAAVEPEHVLVEGGRQGVFVDRARGGAPQPARCAGEDEGGGGAPGGR